jgi:hypothetical protein
MEGVQQLNDFSFFGPNVNDKTISAKLSAKQTQMWPKIIIKKPNHHP